MEQREIFVRAWAPKRRTGCITCKIRHVRCDEGKPACKKCLNTGRKCDGYAFSNGPTSLSTSQSMSVFPSADRREHRAFDYFVACTAPELTGYFSPDIWQQRVPKLSFSESALWHVVIAISSVHEGYAGGIQHSKRDTQLEFYSFALKHYSLAVKSLNEALSSNPKNLESVLLCCALFVCFDSLRGNYMAASAHLKSGIKIILSQKVAQKAKSVDEKLIQTFTCLGLQAGVFMDTYFPESTESLWSQLLLLNNGFDTSSFGTIDDARHAINLSLANFMVHHTRSQNENNTAGLEASINTSTAHDDLATWSHNFDAMILRKNPVNLSSNALRAAIILKLHHASLIALVNAANPEDVPDVNAPYETIVSLSRSLINATASSGRSKSSISSDLGLIGPLFVTIARCTVSKLRWEALALLKAVPRREGMWDAEIAARIALGVLEIEERENPGGLYDVDAVDIKIQQLRLRYNENKMDILENRSTFDLDFERTDKSTGSKTKVTETLLG